MMSSISDVTVSMAITCMFAVTFDVQDTSTRTVESGSTTLAVSAHRTGLPN